MRGIVISVAVIVLAAASVTAASAAAGTGWAVVDLGVSDRGSVATGVNAAGQVVGARRSGEGSYLSTCFVGFLWEKGTSKTIPADGCRGDMWNTAAALAITPGGRVRGTLLRLGWSSSFESYWLWPPAPDPTNSWRAATTPDPMPADLWRDPTPTKGQSARTCWLGADGGTVCGAFRGLPAVTYPKVVRRESCGIQDWPGVAVDDRSHVVAYLSYCQDVNTGELLGPDSYFLAGAQGWVTFGPRGQGTVKALNSKGQAVGAIPVPAGGSHAFLWDGKRIVDLGTLGGRASEATAVNDRSEVVGTSATRSGARHGFLWREGQMVDLGATTPLGVNQRGEVLGFRMEGKRLHLFLWRDGRTTGLGYWNTSSRWLTGGLYSWDEWLSLDDLGRVAGADEAGHAVVWEAGRRTRLPELPGAKGSAALHIDATGGIAGWSTDADGIPHAVLWTLKP